MTVIIIVVQQASPCEFVSGQLVMGISAQGQTVTCNLTHGMQVKRINKTQGIGGGAWVTVKGGIEAIT